MTKNVTLELELRAIRERARKDLDAGAVTGAYKADRERVIEALNGVLATETVCELRYRNHYHRAQGVLGDAVASEFLEHAVQEREHATMIAERIGQLGGVADFDPATLLERSHAEFTNPSALGEMIRDNLIAERIAIETYAAIIRWIGDDDPTTRRMLERILEQEEEHADDLAKLLGTAS